MFFFNKLINLKPFFLVEGSNEQIYNSYKIYQTSKQKKKFYMFIKKKTSEQVIDVLVLLILTSKKFERRSSLAVILPVQDLLTDQKILTVTFKRFSK